MQPTSHLRKNEALPFKVVIISTHALPHIPRDFVMVKALASLNFNGNLRCIVNGEEVSKNPIKLSKKKTHRSHKYHVI